MHNLKSLLDDHQTGHSEFQDDYLITVKAGGTPYGQYKQSLRELYKRFRGLREMLCDQKRLHIEIQQLAHLIDTERDSFKKELLKVDLMRKQMQTEEAERGIYNTKREFMRFYQQAAALKEQIGDLDDDKRRELDRGMWMFKAKQMAAIDFLVNGRIRESTLTMVVSMPEDMRNECLAAVKDQDNLVQWYENQSHVELPEMDAAMLAFDEQKLLEML